FLPGARTTGGASAIIISGPYLFPAVRSVRIDHCHFEGLHQARMIWLDGKVYGVADHNVCRYSENVYFIAFSEGDLNIDPGDEVWADFAWFGTDKFFFLEDDYIANSGVQFRYATDTLAGARWVERHCYFQDLVASNDHGTEARPREDRAREFYDNVVN